MNSDSGRVPSTSEPEAALPDADTMDIDEEDPPTNPQASSKTHGRTTLRKDKDVRGVNIAPLPQIRLKGPRREPSLKGKKRATLEDEDEEDEDEEDKEDNEEDEDEDEEMEEEEEMVCVQLKLIAHN
jgi:hypothetical protein